VATVSPEKGRFRSFLLASLNHFLSDDWDKARAQQALALLRTLYGGSIDLSSLRG